MKFVSSILIHRTSMDQMQGKQFHTHFLCVNKARNQNEIIVPPKIDTSQYQN